MATELFTDTSTLLVKTCPTCFMRYAAPQLLFGERAEDGKCWYCPNGHQIVFRESDTDKLRKELIQTQARLDQEKAAADHARKQRDKANRSATAFKGAVTRLKNKTAKGQCPCCERLFPDLAGHMATEHPDFEGREEPTETPKPE